MAPQRFQKFNNAPIEREKAIIALKLVHGSIEKDGNEIHVSKCPDGHGMIKSPMCCGQDMACSV